MRLILLCVAAALSCLASCGGTPRATDPLTRAPEADPACGTWNIDAPKLRAAILAQLKETGKVPPDATEDHPDLKNEFVRLSAMKFTLSIDPPGTFTADVNIGRNPSQATGVWSRSGDDIRLETLKEDGRDSRTHELLLFRQSGPAAAELFRTSGSQFPMPLRRD